MIRFDNITKQYAGTSRPALNAIDLEILRGEFVFLVGASGSGKSSCLRLILKEDKPTRGNIHVLGQNLNSISNRKVPYFRRNLGVVFQDFRLLPNKSVFDNVAFTLQVIGKSRGFIQEAVPDVLKMVGLAGKASRLPHELSGGEQQRVAIARAIVNKPALLLADEPTGNLDPSTSAGIMSLLERINAGGTTVVMATHEAGIVDKMQRRVVELVSGQIVRDEREGGYGFTAAITKQPDAVTDTPPPPVPDPVVDVPPETHPAWPDAPEREPAPMPSAPRPFASMPPAYMPPAPVAATAAVGTDSALAAAPDTSSVRLSDHFATRPVQPVARPESGAALNVPLGDASRDDSFVNGASAASQERTEALAVGADDVDSSDGAHDEYSPTPLTLAEKLGLRAPGISRDTTTDQNVGPTS